MYSVLGLAVSSKDIGSEIFPNALTLFSFEAHEWVFCRLEEVAVDVHAIEGAGEDDVS